MSNQLFQDNLQARTSLAYQMRFDERKGKRVPVGPPIGVRVHLPCPECGRELWIDYSWQEVQHLLGGGQLQGVWPDGRGWRAQVQCVGKCISPTGRTQVPYRISYDDLLHHLQNLQAGRRQAPPPPQGQGGPGPYGNQGGGGQGWY